MFHGDGRGCYIYCERRYNIPQEFPEKAPILCSDRVLPCDVGSSQRQIPIPTLYIKVIGKSPGHTCCRDTSRLRSESYTSVYLGQPTTINRREYGVMEQRGCMAKANAVRIVLCTRWRQVLSPKVHVKFLLRAERSSARMRIPGQSIIQKCMTRI